MKATITIDVEKLINALTGLSSDDYTLEILEKCKAVSEEKTRINLNNGREHVYLSTKQIMKKFQIGSDVTVLQLFKTKGSPAFKNGKNWMCDEEEFRMFLKKRSDIFKG